MEPAFGLPARWIVPEARELMAVGRASACTLVAAVLGKLALNPLANASLPLEQGPMANEAGIVGSLVDPSLSANVPQQQDEGSMALSGER